ncbi:TetR/AcrR family transcriptional regulator [Haliangium sp.]|uniref:TetR/AcrR family transcriptional regulator n=1 Tax=Haliangium sp. TaxID=2663208 RepID=UPI003D0FC89E
MADAPDTRSHLLACARDLYLEHGMSGFSMRKVAQRAGLSATAIYRHYDSKEALITAVTEEGFVQFANYLWRGLAGTTPLDRLRAAGEGYLRFGVEQSPYYRIIFMSAAEELGFECMPETLQRKAEPTFQFLVDRVRECIDAGDMVADDPVELAATIWAFSHGLVSLWLSGQMSSRFSSPDHYAVFYARAQERLLRGLRP